MIDLQNPRLSRYSDNVSATWARVSGVNFNENGTLRIEVDFFVDEQAFIDGKEPLDSEQFNDLPGLPAVNNAVKASLLANTDIDG